MLFIRNTHCQFPLLAFNAVYRLNLYYKGVTTMYLRPLSVFYIAHFGGSLISGRYSNIIKYLNSDLQYCRVNQLTILIFKHDLNTIIFLVA